MVNARAVLVYGWRRRAGLGIAGHHYRGWRWSPAMDGLRCQVLPRSDFTSCADPSRTIRGFVASVCSIHGTRKAQSSDFTARPSSTRSWSTMF